jgi:Domain of unknown function (DUF4439)
VTSAEPSGAGQPTRPSDAADGAIYDAIATEHGIIYGYGLVSAHATPDQNSLVSASLGEHRARREAAIALLDARSVAAPLPAAGYQLPIQLTDPTDAVSLAVRMEDDAATAWRAVVEQATRTEDRTFAITALTQCAVAAARWMKVRGTGAVTVPFPGGTESG